MRPWGFVLFKRNIETRVKYPLVMELRNFLDKADAPVLIDQEGGRVVRLDRRISRSIRAGAAFGDPALGLEAARLRLPPDREPGVARTGENSLSARTSRTEPTKHVDPIGTLACA